MLHTLGVGPGGNQRLSTTFQVHAASNGVRGCAVSARVHVKSAKAETLASRPCQLRHASRTVQWRLGLRGLGFLSRAGAANLQGQMGSMPAAAASDTQPVGSFGEGRLGFRI